MLARTSSKALTRPLLASSSTLLKPLPAAILRPNGSVVTPTTASSSRLAPVTAQSRSFQSSVKRLDQHESTRPEIDTPPDLFSFTEEEQMLRDSVKKWAEEVVGPRVQAMDESELMDPEIIKGLFEQGLMGIETSADHGGSEMSFMATILAVEELAKIDPSVSVCCDVHSTLVNSTLRLWGSDELKDKYLPQLATEKLGSFCLSEPASGSDAFALQTTAKEDGDHYIINGSKMWITNSAEADLFIVFANVDPSKGYKGITAFMVEKEWGINIAKKEKKLGIKASSTCLLSLDDVRVPKTHIIGEVGKGYKIAIEVLNEGRIGIAAQMIGLAQGAFNKAMQYIWDRKQFGKSIGDNQGMKFQYADVATEIEAARLLTYNAARLKEAGKPFVREAAMAKYYAANVAQKAAGLSIEWCGGVGFTREVGIEKYWRDSMIGQIYEGTRNIQLETIAKLIKKDYT